MPSSREEWPGFDDSVALGLIPGFSNTSRWHELASATNTQKEMTNAGVNIRTLPVAAAVISIVSSSPEDDLFDGVDAGTGIHQVHVSYLDENWNEAQETVTLNGTAPVTTTGTALRFIEAHGEVVGSTGAAVGNITFSIGGNAQERILPTQNETRTASIHCPNGKFILVRSVEIYTGRSATVDVDIAIEVRDQASGLWYTVTSGQLYQQAIDLSDVRWLLGPQDDMRVLVLASGSSGPAVHCKLHGWKINKGTLDALDSRYSLYGPPKVVRG